MDPQEEELELTNPGEQPPEPAPAVPPAPAPEEPEEPEEPAAPSQDEEEPDGPVKTGSPRLDKRIERFSMKLRNEFVQKNRQPSQDEPYKPANLEDMEYDPETLDLLKQDRQRIADDAYRRGAGEKQAQIQERFIDRFEVDADRVTAKYPQMDEDNKDFDPDLAADLNQKFLAFTGYDERTGVFHNPIMRYKDFIDAEMATLERYAGTRNADTATEVARQASRAGVRPSGGGRSAAVDLSPMGIRKMKPEEYEKNRPAIEAEIRRSMGL